jgi:NADPH2:quinone reductase
LCGTCEWCESGRDHACPDIRVLGVKTPGLGGYAEKIALPAENVLALSEGISIEQAASTCVQFGTAWWMLRNAELEPGETLLVTGASGGVGHALTQIGVYTGATVIGTTTTAEKMDWIRERGADHLIHAETEDVPERVAELTDGRGVDVVAETVGRAAWADSMDSLAMQGRLVLCGAHTGSEAPLDFGQLFGGEHTVMGSKRAPKATMRRVIRLIADGCFEPVITERYPLEETASALAQIDSGDHVGRILVTV